MAIDGGLRDKLEAGTRLVARYKGAEHVAEVVTDGDGKTRYRLADGRMFKSPSAAASAVMGGMAANGWRWWSVEGASPPKPATPTGENGTAPAQTPDAATAKPRPQCIRCGKTFVGEQQLAHHDAHADRLCAPV